MKPSNRAFEDTAAVRSRVPLLVGLVGPSGGGKTKSALRLATGIQAASGGEVYSIDTESRRALHYADEHKFRHLEFKAPFGSLDYLAAIQHCVKKGASVVIVDSMSHEHEGPGGLLDYQEKELDQLAGDDQQKRDRMNMLAWQKPKAARRALINGLLQLNANFIFCFRAREKTKPIKRDGKTEIVELGFMPIAGEEFLFEMTVNCYLLPRSNGVPTWQSDHVGEKTVMKLPSYLAHAFTAGQPLDEATGRKLAEWAAGRATTVAAPDKPTSEDQYITEARLKITETNRVAALLAWWNSDAEKAKRRACGLSTANLAALMAEVKHRRTELENVELDKEIAEGAR